MTRRLRREVLRVRQRTGTSHAKLTPPKRSILTRAKALGVLLWRAVSSVTTLITSIAVVVIAWASWETQERQRHFELKKEDARFRAEVVFLSPSGRTAGVSDPFDPKLPASLTLTSSGTAEEIETLIRHSVSLRPHKATIETPTCHVVFDDWFGRSNRGGPRFQASEAAMKTIRDGFILDNDGGRWDVRSERLLLSITYSDVMRMPRQVNMEIVEGVQRSWEVPTSDHSFSEGPAVSFSRGSPIVISSASAPVECAPLLDVMAPLGDSGLRAASRGIPR